MFYILFDQTFVPLRHLEKLLIQLYINTFYIFKPIFIFFAADQQLSLLLRMDKFERFTHLLAISSGTAGQT